LEKDYPIKVNYTTVWKTKQRALKELYDDWANTFSMLYSFKTEVEKRSPDSIVEIDTEVTKNGKVFFSKFFMASTVLKRGTVHIRWCHRLMCAKPQWLPIASTS
jgi:hypothetical protein